MKRIALVIVLSVTCFTALSQPVGLRKMDFLTDPDRIVGESQVWDIECVSGGGDGCPGPRTFLATNDGLFVYDGVRLQRHFSPEINSLRDLAWNSATGRLYSAGNNGFGWWQDDGFGRLVYHSLIRGEYSARFQDFWRVSISASGKVFFQSLGRICIYDPPAGEIITVQPSRQFRYMYDVRGEVYVQDGDVLCRLGDDGRLDALCSIHDRIMNMVDCKGLRIVALERSGLMVLDGNNLCPLDKNSNRLLSEAKIMSLAVFEGNRLLVGTTQGGLFVTDTAGRILPDMHREMQNATVLSVAVDLNGDVWLGMEAGVARIDIHSNRFYLEDSRLGTVRGIVPLEDGRLLVGSNKGAFIYADKTLLPVPGTTGSVWNIVSFDGKPYLAHDQGILSFTGPDSIVPLYTETGVMSIVRSHHYPDRVICGTYNGLALFRKEGDALSFQSHIDNYTGFVRSIFWDDNDRLWVRDSHKGFIRLTLDPTHTKVTGRKDFRLVRDEKDIVFSIDMQGRRYFCCNRETYLIDPETEELVRSEEGDRLLAAFGERYGMPFEDRNATNPICLDAGCYATGLHGGIRFSYGSRVIRESLYVSMAESLGAGKRELLPLDDTRKVIPSDRNTVSVFLAGNLAGKTVEYRILPGPEEWRKTDTTEPFQLSALPFGNHDVEFRIPDATETACVFRLRVLRPWYLTSWAFCGYLLLILLLSQGIRAYYLRQARKEQERVRLKSELRANSKELANITFNNAKRNRQLNEIRARLTDRKTVALIDSYLADESDWEKSEEYFNVIYDGLLEELKKTYPGISKTDMKICVYTKLNLSTKEIADIMNISVRSVEMARYRLRKRLNLPPGQDISEMLQNLPATGGLPR